jgi:hypothetical protein
MTATHILHVLLWPAGGVSLDLGPSRLLHLLQRTAWLPTTDGALARPHEAVARSAAMLQVGCWPWSWRRLYMLAVMHMLTVMYMLAVMYVLHWFCV